VARRWVAIEAKSSKEYSKTSEKDLQASFHIETQPNSDRSIKQYNTYSANYAQERSTFLWDRAYWMVWLLFRFQIRITVTRILSIVRIGMTRGIFEILEQNWALPTIRRPRFWLSHLSFLAHSDNQDCVGWSRLLLNFWSIMTRIISNDLELIMWWYFEFYMKCQQNENNIWVYIHKSPERDRSRVPLILVHFPDSATPSWFRQDIKRHLHYTKLGQP